MITRKNVQNSSLEFEPLVVDVDTVYKNFNEYKVFDEETKEHIGWKYDQIQYDKNEYIELISKENNMLNIKNKALEEEISMLNEGLFELVMQVYN